MTKHYVEFIEIHDAFILFIDQFPCKRMMGQSKNNIRQNRKQNKAFLLSLPKIMGKKREM